MRLLSALLFVIFVSTCYGQQIVCDRICKQKLDYDHPKAMTSTLKQLKNCGLDDIDIRFFSQGPILGSILVQLANHNSALTYGDLLKEFIRIKHTDNYWAARKKMLSTLRKPTDIK